MPPEPCPDCGFTGPYDGHVCEETPIERLREAVEHGTVVFSPPWLADVLLEIVARLEALETLEIAEQEERVAFSEGRSAYERLVSPPPIEREAVKAE